MNRDDLVNDLGGGEVTFDALEAGRAELAAVGAADLRRNTHRVPVALRSEAGGGWDENSLDELINAIGTRGDEVQTLIKSGRVFTVPNKTRVRIIEADFAKLKVRIIEGDKIMAEVWVPERWVR